MDKFNYEILRKTWISDIISQAFMPHMDNSKSHKISLTCAGDIYARVKKLINHTKVLEEAAIEYDDVEFDRQAVMQRIQNKLGSNVLSHQEELKYITELNKMEDNYVKNQAEQEINVTIVDYKPKALDDTQEEV